MTKKAIASAEQLRQFSFCPMHWFIDNICTEPKQNPIIQWLAFTKDYFIDMLSRYKLIAIDIAQLKKEYGDRIVEQDFYKALDNVTQTTLLVFAGKVIQLVVKEIENQNIRSVQQEMDVPMFAYGPKMSINVTCVFQRPTRLLYIDTRNYTEATGSVTPTMKRLGNPVYYALSKLNNSLQEGKGISKSEIIPVTVITISSQTVVELNTNPEVYVGGPGLEHMANAMQKFYRLPLKGPHCKTSCHHIERCNAHWKDLLDDRKIVTRGPKKNVESYLKLNNQNEETKAAEDKED